MERPNIKNNSSKGRNVVKYIMFVFIVLFICFFELPYYIEKPGGLDNITNKIKIKGAYSSEGTINLTYVSELKGNLPLLLIAFIAPDWKIEPKNDGDEGELDYNSNMIRQRILMKQSYTTSIKYAYERSGKNIDVLKELCYVIYILDGSDNDFSIGDQIIKVDDHQINSTIDLKQSIANKKIGDKVEVQVVNNNQTGKRYAVLTDDGEGNAVLGIGLGVEYLLETDPTFDFKYNNMEYGPSGGLMISLAVYNSLTKEDITGGKTISGTGTLSDDGVVGPVGGIEYKLKGAVKSHADIFFVPSFENYDEAIELKKKHNYDIDVVKVECFDDALSYLKDNVMNN